MTSIARKKHVEDWQAGGLSIATFCRANLSSLESVLRMVREAVG